MTEIITRFRRAVHKELSKLSYQQRSALTWDLVFLWAANGIDMAMVRTNDFDGLYAICVQNVCAAIDYHGLENWILHPVK